MHTVRKSSLIVLLTALALLFGIITPSVAQADEVTSLPWPLELQNNMLPDHMAAFGGNDGMSLVNCGNTQQASSFEYLYEGAPQSSLPQYNNGGVSCGGNQGLATPDGTFYTTYVTNPSSSPQPYTFVAMKNGRMLWQTDVSSNPGTCSAAGGSQTAVMTFASQGSDGNIYGIIQSTSTGCATYLAKVNATNGQIMFKQQLTVDGSNKGSRLWVYADKLLTVDYAGNLRQFDLNGVENKAAAYQFPLTWGYGTFYANANGRVFMVASYDYSSNPQDTYIAYHDPDGTTGSGATGLGVNPSGVTFVPGGNGTLVAYNYWGYIETFSFTSSGVTSSTITLSLPSGATSQGIHQYWQDQNGNAVVTRQLGNASGSFFGVSVDRIDGATGAVTNLFSMTQDSTHPNPYLRVADVTPDGSYLYAMVCHDVSSCPNTASTSIDEWIHKIPLPSFGAPVKDTGGFTTYTSTKLNYVAMGDSFSAGEGNSPYFSWTDTSDNQCHRSNPSAYPEWLAQTPSLNLNLTDFVACSGATTDNVLNGGQYGNELPQVDALDDRTDVVTITIGGNDIGFVPFAKACVLSDCDSSTSIYATTMHNIDYNLDSKLTATYEAIAQRATKARIYVVGYPQVAPDTTTTPLSEQCGYFNSSSGASLDAVAARAVVKELDGKISAAVTEANSALGITRLVYVDPEGSPAATFDGHDVCSGPGVTYFFNVTPNDAVFDESKLFHPDVDGQYAYYQIVQDYMTR